MGVKTKMEKFKSKKEVKLLFYRSFEHLLKVNKFFGFGSLRKLDSYLEYLIDKYVSNDKEYSDFEILKLTDILILNILKNYNKKDEYCLVFLDNVLNRLISQINFVEKKEDYEPFEVTIIRICDTLTKYYGLDFREDYFMLSNDIDFFYYYLLLTSTTNNEDLEMFKKFSSYLKKNFNEEKLLQYWLYEVYEYLGQSIGDYIYEFSNNRKLFEECIEKTDKGEVKMVMFEKLYSNEQTEMVIEDFLCEILEEEHLENHLIKNSLREELYESLREITNHFPIYLIYSAKYKNKK